MSKVNKKKLKIFDRAYDKAAKMKPGDPDPLYPMELKVLMEFVYTRQGLKIPVPPAIRKATDND